MFTYTYSTARQKFRTVLNQALKDGKVRITGRDGRSFVIISDTTKNEKSPFDVQGVGVKATKNDILQAIKDSRERA